jgi:hypothetical protein
MGKSNGIRAAVKNDLTFDTEVDASDIRVEEMDGDAVLTGASRAIRSTSRRPRWRLALPASDAYATTCRSRFRPAITATT